MALSKTEIKVGLFITIPFFLIFSFSLLKLGYSFASSTIDVYLKVDSIKAIKKGTAVKVKGYTVGRVVEIKPVYKPDLHFLAVMRIQNEIDIYEDCSAIIQNQNVIGDAVIELRNPLKHGKRVENGDVIEGIEYVNIEALLNNVNTLLTNVNSTIGVFKDMSVENRGNLKKLVVNLGESVATTNALLMNSQKEIAEILASFRETAKNLQQTSKEFNDHPIKFLRK